MLHQNPSFSNVRARIQNRLLTERLGMADEAIAELIALVRESHCGLADHASGLENLRTALLNQVEPIFYEIETRGQR